MNPDCLTESELYRLGYLRPRVLESGELAALVPFIYTVGLCVGITRDGYRARFCYHDYQSADRALADWRGYGVPKGPYIAHKGQGEILVDPVAEAEETARARFVEAQTRFEFD